VASINEPLRPIRSFVRREGRITGAQKEALETLQSAYGIDASQTIGKAYPFSHDTRIHLEIGFGDGETLIALAKACPEDGFIGIDPHRPGAGRLLLRLKQEQIDNVRVIVGDAAEQLPALIEPDSLSRVLILFPDPWPKKRHQKRRLVNTAFLRMLSEKIKRDGVLHLATDWLEYAEQMLETLSEIPAFKNLDASGRYSPRPDWRPETKYERRGLRLGHDVFDISRVRK